MRENEIPTPRRTHIVAINNVLLYRSVSTLVMEGRMKKVVIFLCQEKDCTLQHEKHRYLQGEILVCKKV